MASEKARELRKQANVLFDQAKEEERKVEIDKQTDDAAYHIASMRRAFVEQGFTEDEAYDLIKAMIMTGGKK